MKMNMVVLGGGLVEDAISDRARTHDLTSLGAVIVAHDVVDADGLSRYAASIRMEVTP